jgi:hypothetical protein
VGGDGSEGWQLTEVPGGSCLACWAQAAVSRQRRGSCQESAPGLQAAHSALREALRQTDSVVRLAHCRARKGRGQRLVSERQGATNQHSGGRHVAAGLRQTCRVAMRSTQGSAVHAPCPWNSARSQVCSAGI